MRVSGGTSNVKSVSRLVRSFCVGAAASISPDRDGSLTSYSDLAKENAQTSTRIIKAKNSTETTVNLWDVGSKKTGRTLRRASVL